MSTGSSSPIPSKEEDQARIAQWRGVAIEQANRSDLWGLEALRNLVLLNAAGLAGAMAAFQVKGVAEQMFWPAAGFLFGIGAGCLSITIGWVLHRIAASRYQSNHAAYVASGNLNDLFGQNMRMLRAINGASIFTGVASFGAFFWGAYRLLRVFF